MLLWLECWNVGMLEWLEWLECWNGWNVGMVGMVGMLEWLEWCDGRASLSVDDAPSHVLCVHLSL